MRLTAFTDFGLRALMQMASAPDRSFSTADIADHFGISRNHLGKVMGALANAGIITTRRGTGGGAVLARPADQIRLGDLVQILEDGQALVDCFANGGGTCAIRGQCRLKSRLRSAEAAFLNDLNKSTLADIALENVT
jgi:Rrf2 family nitric oxide-sensitive transcriptional repressor